VQVLVGTTSLKEDLNVVFVLSQIGWVLLEVNHGSSCCKTVLWECLCLSEILALVGVEFSRELVAINDSENASIDVQVDSE